MVICFDILFCLVVAIFDLVHDVEAMYTWPMLTAISTWKSFLKYDLCLNCSFTGITDIS